MPGPTVKYHPHSGRLVGARGPSAGQTIDTGPTGSSAPAIIARTTGAPPGVSAASAVAQARAAAAARAQQRAVHQYVAKEAKKKSALNEKPRLLDAYGRPKPGAPIGRAVGEDIHHAAQRLAKANIHNIGLTPHQQKAVTRINSQGKVVGPKALGQIVHYNHKKQEAIHGQKAMVAGAQATVAAALPGPTGGIGGFGEKVGGALKKVADTSTKPIADLITPPEQRVGSVSKKLYAPPTVGDVALALAPVPSLKIAKFLPKVATDAVKAKLAVPEGRALLSHGVISASEKVAPKAAARAGEIITRAGATPVVGRALKFEAKPISSALKTSTAAAVPFTATTNNKQFKNDITNAVHALGHLDARDIAKGGEVAASVVTHLPTAVDYTARALTDPKVRSESLYGLKELAFSAVAFPFLVPYEIGSKGVGGAAKALGEGYFLHDIPRRWEPILSNDYSKFLSEAKKPGSGGVAYQVAELLPLIHGADVAASGLVRTGARGGELAGIPGADAIRKFYSGETQRPLLRRGTGPRQVRELQASKGFTVRSVQGILDTIAQNRARAGEAKAQKPYKIGKRKRPRPAIKYAESQPAAVLRGTKTQRRQQWKSLGENDYVWVYHGSVGRESPIVGGVSIGTEGRRGASSGTYVTPDLQYAVRHAQGALYALRVRKRDVEGSPELTLGKKGYEDESLFPHVQGSAGEGVVSHLPATEVVALRGRTEAEVAAELAGRRAGERPPISQHIPGLGRPFAHYARRRAPGTMVAEERFVRAIRGHQLTKPALKIARKYNHMKEIAAYAIDRGVPVDAASMIRQLEAKRKDILESAPREGRFSQEVEHINKAIGQLRKNPRLINDTFKRDMNKLRDLQQEAERQSPLLSEGQVETRRLSETAEQLSKQGVLPSLKLTLGEDATWKKDGRRYVQAIGRDKIEQANIDVGLGAPGYFPARRHSPAENVLSEGPKSTIPFEASTGALSRVGGREMNILRLPEEMSRLQESDLRQRIIQGMEKGFGVDLDALRRGHDTPYHDIASKDLKPFQEVEELRAAGYDPSQFYRIDTKTWEKRVKDKLASGMEPDQAAADALKETSESVSAGGSATGRFVPRDEFQEVQQLAGLGGPEQKAYVWNRIKTFATRYMLANPGWLAFQMYAPVFLAGIGKPTALLPERLHAARKFVKEAPRVESENFERVSGLMTPTSADWSYAAGSIGAGIKFIDRLKETDSWVQHFQGRNPMDMFFGAIPAWERPIRRSMLHSEVKREAWKRMGGNITRIGHIFDQITLRTKAAETLAEHDSIMHEIAADLPTMERLGREVKQWLGDYEVYTAGEKKYLQNNLLFYGFLRHSMMLAVYTLPVKHPVRLAVFSAMSKMASSEEKQANLQHTRETFSQFAQDHFAGIDEQQANKLARLLYVRTPQQAQASRALIVKHLMQQHPQMTKAKAKQIARSTVTMMDKIPAELMGRVMFPDGRVVDTVRASPLGNSILQAESPIQLLGITHPGIQTAGELLTGTDFFTGAPLQWTPDNKNVGPLDIARTAGAEALNYVSPLRLMSQALSKYPSSERTTGSFPLPGPFNALFPERRQEYTGSGSMAEYQRQLIRRSNQIRTHGGMQGFLNAVAPFLPHPQSYSDANMLIALEALSGPAGAVGKFESGITHKRALAAAQWKIKHPTGSVVLPSDTPGKKGAVVLPSDRGGKGPVITLPSDQADEAKAAYQKLLKPTQAEKGGPGYFNTIKTNIETLFGRSFFGHPKGGGKAGTTTRAGATPSDQGKLGGSTFSKGGVNPVEAFFAGLNNALGYHDGAANAKLAQQRDRQPPGPHPTSQKKISPMTKKLLTKAKSFGPDGKEMAAAAIKFGNQTGVNPSVLMAIGNVESGFNHGGAGGLTTSYADARGAMQFIPSTRDMVLQKHGVDAYKSPTDAVHAAALLLSDAGFKSDPSGAIFSYNHDSSYVAGVQSAAQTTYAAYDKGSARGVQGNFGVKLTKPAKHYVYPFSPKKGKVVTGRIDQGVDYTGSGPIRAMANAKVVDVNGMGWPNGGAGPTGQNVAYKILDGPQKGKYVFVAEGITPHVKAGQTVKKGEVIASFFPGSSIETGWYSASDHNALAHTHYTEGDVTAEGKDFFKWLDAIQTGKSFASGGTADFGTAPTGVSVSSSGVMTPVTATPATTAARTGSIPAPVTRAGATPLQALSQLRSGGGLGLALPGIGGGGGGATSALSGLPGLGTTAQPSPATGVLSPEVTQSIAATRKRLLSP